MVPTSPVLSSRGRLNAAQRHDPHGDHSRLRADLAAAKLEQYIEKVVSSAPPLTDSQRSRLAALLTGGASR